MTDTAPAFRACWARSLGNCSGPMSREHIFSRGVYRQRPGHKIAVQGMASMEDGSIGPEPLAARILCAKHNADLSRLDEEATKLADALHAFHDGADGTTVAVSGPLLERWALKTFIDHMTAGLGDELKWQPDEALVKIAYGVAEFPDGLGLYSLRVEDHQPLSDEQTAVSPAWLGDQLAGAIVYLHGAAFFIAINANFLRVIEKKGIARNDAFLPFSYDALTYRPRRARLENDEGRSIVVDLQW